MEPCDGSQRESKKVEYSAQQEVWIDRIDPMGLTLNGKYEDLERSRDFGEEDEGDGEKRRRKKMDL